MNNDPLEFYRKEFPHINDGTIYCNHASISPLPLRVTQAVNRHLELRQKKHIDPFPSDAGVVQQARSNIARLIRANNPADIAFIPNTTEGLNIIANGFPFEPGDRVLLHPLEFPTNQYPWLNQRQRGVRIDYLQENSGQIHAEDVEKLLNPKTRVFALSAVQFLSGWKADLKTLSKICRDNGTRIIVDGIQSCGAMTTDVTGNGVDAWVNGGHKWMMAPQGIGFMYLKPEFREMLRQASKGWLSVREPWDMFNLDQELDPGTSRFENGMLNFAGIYGLNAAADLLLEAGPVQIEKKILKLSSKLRSGLESVGIRIYSSGEPDFCSGITTVFTPYSNEAEKLVSELAEKNAIISERNGMLRLSPHFYMDETDISNLIEFLS